MSLHLIQSDIKLMRSRYDEALSMQGIPCKYQYPNLPDTNVNGEPVIDSYSDLIDTFIFFDGNPKVKTYKRLGWVVANDADLPFLIHCSFNLPHVQRDCLFRIGGHFAEIPDKVFRVTEITYDLQAPDHIVCQVIPVYDEQRPTGRTDKEISTTFNKSNHFIKQNVDYRGQYRDNTDGDL